MKEIMKVIFWVFMGVISMSALSYFGLRFVQSYGQEIFPNPASEEFFSYISNSIGLAVAAVAAIATIFLAYQALNEGHLRPTVVQALRNP